MYSGLEIAAATALPATVAAIFVLCLVPRRDAGPSAGSRAGPPPRWLQLPATGPPEVAIRPLAAWGLSCAIGLAMLASLGVREAQEQRAVARGLAEREVPPTMSEWLPAARAAVLRAWHPAEGYQWLTAIVLSLLAVTWPVLHLERRVSMVGWLVLSALMAGMALRLLWGSVYLTRQWSCGLAASYLAAMGLGLGTLWWLGVRQDRDEENDSFFQLFSASIIIACLAAVLAGSGSLKLGFLAGALAWALLGAWLAAWFDGRTAPPGGVSGPLVVLGGALLLLGYFYADVDAPAAWGLLVSLGLWAAWPPRMVHGNGGRLLRLTVCVAPALAVGCWTIYQFWQATSATPSNPYDIYL